MEHSDEAGMLEAGLLAQLTLPHLRPTDLELFEQPLEAHGQNLCAVCPPTLYNHFSAASAS